MLRFVLTFLVEVLLGFETVPRLLEVLLFVIVPRLFPVARVLLTVPLEFFATSRVVLPRVFLGVVLLLLETTPRELLLLAFPRLVLDTAVLPVVLEFLTIVFVRLGL